MIDMIDTFKEIHKNKYDYGVQHFKPVNYFGGVERFNNQKRIDKEKNEYCKKNNIKLIRISYIEKDLETIINKII